MREIYAKIYMDGPDTLVLEGRGTADRPGYYPTRWDDTAKRIGTVVCGKEHIRITRDAKAAILRILKEGHHTGDDIGCLEVSRWKEDDVSISWLGPVTVRWNVEDVIRDPDFFLGDGDGGSDLHALEDLTCVERGAL